MNNSSSSKASQTDWDRTHAMSDIPEVTETQMAQAVSRVGGVPVNRTQQSVVLLDASVIEYFKRKADNQDYQTLINTTLSDYIQHL
ncbi:MAG: BrnA antitoxin family protein [Leptolyngbyaceae cyanobacterium CSU_1_3]|nr:BrnA antitoxin family protein [Leptolyngbyaceae cyanobacterium CSU_1_3]